MISPVARRHRIEENTHMNDGRFKKGMTPWNKGKKGYMGANRTSFRKGDNSRPLEERFLEKVNKTDSCWLWTGAKNNMGYGRINVKGVSTLAHRLSYEIHYASPKSSLVLHACDVPSCVNPSHLVLGDQTTNMRDMSTKKRGCNGERATWSKMTLEKANRVRSLYMTSNYSMRELARMFKVSYVTINFIINNKRWN